MCIERNKSIAIYNKARKHILGGVNSPFRALGILSGERPPVAINRGNGPFVWDADGNKYIDYLLSCGPLVLGHANPVVVEAIKSQTEQGTGFGSITNLELNLAELITRAYHLDKVRFVNSGTEATMSAIRLARGFTERDKFIEFEGGYHGHSDSLLAGRSKGITVGTAKDTLIATYNDPKSVEVILNTEGKNVAAIIVEPIAGNMGLVLPNEDFLPGLRQLADDYGIVLIFDEVLTGFRVAPGGAESIYGVKPDLVTLGKVIGGGLPVGAFGGREEIMNYIAPFGPVFQAGSQAGNALGMAAGTAQLEYLLNNIKIYQRLSQTTNKLINGIYQAAEEVGIPVVAKAVGSIFSLAFYNGKISNYQEALKLNTKMFQRWITEMLNQGIYLAQGPLEVNYLSTVHSDEQVNETINAARDTFQELKNEAHHLTTS